MRVSVYLIALAVIALPGSSAGQTLELGVTTLDAFDQRPIPNATVELLQNGMLVQTATSDVNGNVLFQVTPVGTDVIPESSFALGPAYPTPSRGRVRIPLSLPGSRSTTVYLFDLLGRQLARHDARLSGGEFDIVVDLGGLARGQYFVQVMTDDVAQPVVGIIRVGATNGSKSTIRVAPALRAIRPAAKSASSADYEVRIRAEGYLEGTYSASPGGLDLFAYLQREPSSFLIDGVAYAPTPSATWPLAARHESGASALFGELDGDGTLDVAQLAFPADSVSMSLWTSGGALPSRVVVGDHIFVFDSVRGDTASIGVVYPDGSVTSFDDVVAVSTAGKSAHTAASADSLGQAVRLASCLIEALETSGQLTPETRLEACGSAFVNALATLQGNAALQESAPAFSALVGGSSCTDTAGNPLSHPECLSRLLAFAESEADRLNRFLEQRAAEITRAEAGAASMLTREQAIAIARTEYVDPLAAQFLILGLATQEALPAGTKLGSTTDLIDGVEAVWTLDHPSFLVVVDELPDALLPHPFRYILVNATNGETVTALGYYPPVIDGQSLWATVEERLASPDRFEPVDLANATLPTMDYSYPFGNGRATSKNLEHRLQVQLGNAPSSLSTSTGRRLAAVVEAGTDKFLENVAGDWTTVLEGLGFEVTQFAHDGYRVEEMVDAVAELSREAGEGDKFVLVLISHSYVSHLRLEPGSPILTGPMTDLAWDPNGPNAGSLAVSTLSSLIEESTAEVTNVFVETCGAGAIVDHLTVTNFGPQSGRTVKLYVASSTNRTSRARTFLIPEDEQTAEYSFRMQQGIGNQVFDSDGDGAISLDELEAGMDAVHQAVVSVGLPQSPPPIGDFPHRTVEIGRPANGAVFPFGESIAFEATAVAGGDPVSATLTWTSDIDGEIGTTAEFARADLSEGRHTIVAQASYANGTVAQGQVAITVGIRGLPQVSITQPAPNATFRRGIDTEFSATATDPEDGNIPDQNVLWTSDRDGDIGSGTSFVKSDLSEGTHIITVTATDSDGNMSSAVIVVTVETGLPVPEITTPLDGSTHETGGFVNFVGSAIDPEDGVLEPAQLRWESDRMGPLGTGRGFIRDDLAVGTHVITLFATDSDGNEVSTSVTIEITQSNADLALNTFVPPTGTLRAGGTFTATATVRNQGTGPAAGVQVEVFLSADENLDDGDTQVGSAAVSGDLAPNQSATLDITGMVPLGFTPGNYRWIARTTTTSTESGEGPNTAVDPDVQVIEAANLISETNGEITAIHQIGLSPCPNPIGTLQLTNQVAQQPIDVTIAWQPGNGAVSTTLTTTTIAGGGSSSVPVSFTCAVLENTTGNVSVTATVAGAAQEIQVPVTVAVQRQGVVLSYTLGSFSAGSFIALSRISGGEVAGPEGGCAFTHLHTDSDITIDGQGPFSDPDPFGCGFGVIQWAEGGL